MLGLLLQHLYTIAGSKGSAQVYLPANRPGVEVLSIHLYDSLVSTICC